MGKKKIAVAFGMLLLLFLVGGCGQRELTKADIKGTEYYQDLEAKYSQLERKYEKLKEEISSGEELPEDAETYIKSIKRSTFHKVRYSENSTGNYEISDNVSLCNWLKKQLVRGIVETNQNAEEWKNEQAALYQYTLYNEDNSICQCHVYDGDYVVFDALPDTVYYVAQVSRIGDGCFGRDDGRKTIKRSLVARLYDSQLMFENGEVKSIAESKELAVAFEKCKGKIASKKPSDVEAGSKKEYIFKCDGDTYMMEVYESCFSITQNGGDVTWYQSEKELVQQFIKTLD